MANLLKISVAAKVSLLGVAIAFADPQVNVSGDWLGLLRVPQFVNPPRVIYPDAAHIKALKSAKISGYHTLALDLQLSSNHRFIWKPLGWTGTWAYSNKKLTLRPDGNSGFLNMWNAYSQSSTHGVPDLNITYHPADKTLHWVTGSKAYKSKWTLILVRAKG